MLKITDSSDLTKAKVEDAAGNKYVLNLSNVSNITGTAGKAKQITVNEGMEGAIKATVSEDGKTTWELSDASAWKAVGEHTVTDTYASSSVFAFSDAVATDTAHHYMVTLTDGAGNTYRNVEVDFGADASGTSGFFTGAASFVKIDGELQAQTAAFTGSEAGTSATAAATTTDVVTGRPLKDLTGDARDIKGTFTYTVDAGASATFKVSDIDGTNLTATLTDKDGNVFKNVDISSVSDQTSGSDIETATEIVIDNSGGTNDVQFSFSMAKNGIVVGDDGQDLTTGASFSWDSIAKAYDNSADADAQGTMTEANTIYIDNGGSVQDMAETMQTMIGNTTIKVSVEDSTLQIQTLDTSSVAVKDGKVLGTNGSANGVGFASAFGLDQGKTVTLEKSDTAESLRQKIAKIDGVTAEFDKDGHLVVKSEQGDDMVISGELADKLGVTGAATNGNNERAAYSKQFNALLGQIDDLVKDTSYKGINLLNGDNLTVNFNENRTSSLELKGVKFDSVGLGFTQADNEWISNESIDKSLGQIMKATSMLRTQASEFGQNLSTVQIREDFTQNMINNLQAGADKLTLADMNEEGATMLALQTRQQLGTSSLSLASQASQSVLRLF